MKVKIVPTEKGNWPGKLADVELHFEMAPGRRKADWICDLRASDGAGRNVTLPARQYSMNGGRRSFALLRPLADIAAQDHIRDLILEAYAQHESEASQDVR